MTENKMCDNCRWCVYSENQRRCFLNPPQSVFIDDHMWSIQPAVHAGGLCSHWEAENND